MTPQHPGHRGFENHRCPGYQDSRLDFLWDTLRSYIFQDSDCKLVPEVNSRESRIYGVPDTGSQASPSITFVPDTGILDLPFSEIP